MKIHSESVNDLKPDGESECEYRRDNESIVPVGRFISLVRHPSTCDVVCRDCLNSIKKWLGISVPEDS